MPSVDLLYSGGYKWWGSSVTFFCVELLPSVIGPTVQCWIQMVVYQCRLFLYRAGAKCRPTVQRWIQMVDVSVACSSIDLVPSVIRPTVHWFIQLMGCQCRLFLY